VSAVRVAVAANRQVVTPDGEHHYGGEVVTVGQVMAQEWIRWGWARPAEPAVAAPVHKPAPRA
jgi:hypothetical protein